jgi:hypothetical protein
MGKLERSRVGMEAPRSHNGGWGFQKVEDVDRSQSFPALVLSLDIPLCFLHGLQELSLSISSSMVLFTSSE